MGENCAGSADTITKLVREEQAELDKLYEIIRPKPHTRKALEAAPSWLLKKAMKDEIEINWTGTYEVILDTAFPTGSNVIGSHIIYKVKIEDHGKRLQSRPCFHGKREKGKENIRKKFLTAQFDVIRLMASAAACMGLRLASIDIKGAYLQSGPIKSKIYICPPTEYPDKRGVL